MASNPLSTAATNTDMKWAFPQLENPTIIDLSKTGAQDWWQFRPDEDVIFIGASATRTANKVQTDGGRNIVVLGGDYQPQGDSRGATLHFLNLYGSVHVEGVHIDSKNSSQDGIAVAGAPGHQPDVTVQNSVIENIHGAEAEIHADVFQTHGSVGNMHFYNVTGSTNYQGFFISPQYQPSHKSADFENVNIKYTGDSGYTYQYWFLDGTNQSAYPINLKNVYATERAGQHAEEGSVWPKAGLDKIGAVRVGDQITWPSLPYKGSITVGSPTKDFGDVAKAGLNFHVTGTELHSSPGTIPDHDASHPASGAPTNWIQSSDAASHVTGTDGNDQIAGVASKADVHLAGGAGDDTYIVDHPGDTVIEAAGQGVDTVLSYAQSFVLGANVENIVLAGNGQSNATGNDLDNRLVGNSAANVLDGGKGNDLLTGNGGDDTFLIHKGDGNDAITDFTKGDKVALDGFGFTSFDQVKAGLSQVGGDVVLKLADGQTLTFLGTKLADITADQFGFQAPSGSEAPSAGTTAPATGGTTAPAPSAGGSAADAANVHADLPLSGAPTHWLAPVKAQLGVTGTDGNDQIAGVEGKVDLRLAGGQGDDTYIVDHLADRVIEAAGHGTDTVVSYAKAYALPANVENLTLGGNALNGAGNAQANLIVGNDKANVLSGGAGDDILAGGKGADLLVGGEGKDTYRYDSLADAGDHIRGFVAGQDSLDIRNLLHSIGSTSTKPLSDGVVQLVQNGANTDVMVKASEGTTTKLVTLEHVDAHAVQATADHWG